MNMLKKAFALSIALTLSVSCFSACSKKEESSSSVTTVSTKQTTTKKSSSTTTTITRAVFDIPELTCKKIDFGEEYTLFVDHSGRIRLINSENVEISSCTVKDNNGELVTINCQNNSVGFTKDNKKITSFLFGNHSVTVKNGRVFYDGSEVAYSDTSFYSYKINDNLTISVSSAGKFELKDKNRKIIKTANVTDDSGNTMRIDIEENGREIYFIDNNELICPCFKINDKLFVVTGTKIIINGMTLVPQYSYDIRFVTSAAKTTTASRATTLKGNGAVTKATTSATTQKTTTTTKSSAAVAEPETTTTSVTTSPVGSNMINQGISEETMQMLEFVNEIRRQYGLDELYGLQVLDSAAQVRADELAQAYSHLRPDDTNFDTALDDAEISWTRCAENIASGSEELVKISEVFDSLMLTELNRANILDPKMKYMALAKSTGTADGKTVTYYEQLFFNDQYTP